MSCICAKRTDEYHGFECEITGGACMFLIPDQDACADKFGEVEHTQRNYKMDGEGKSSEKEDNL